jgi:hypothetical protein
MHTTTGEICYEWVNTGTGAAIRGASYGASGVIGATYFAGSSSGPKAGVYGIDKSTSVFNAGVIGNSPGGIGVDGAHYFVVREVQGGHGTLSLDYHIYASEMGTAGVRAAAVNEAFLGPRATVAYPARPRVKVPKFPRLH